MSKTYSIACKDCEEQLWIAQGWDKKQGHVYSTPEYNRKLYGFFIKHKRHNLIFDENTDIPIDDYKEFEEKI